MDINFQWIGWMKEGRHDKVWGHAVINGRHYAFWGRRGKALSFKDHGKDWTYSLSKLQTSKERKGYKEIDRFHMFTVFPHFEEDVEKRLSFCVLANKIK